MKKPSQKLVFKPLCSQTPLRSPVPMQIYLFVFRVLTCLCLKLQVTLHLQCWEIHCYLLSTYWVCHIGVQTANCVMHLVHHMDRKGVKTQGLCTCTQRLTNKTLSYYKVCLNLNLSPLFEPRDIIYILPNCFLGLYHKFGTLFFCFNLWPVHFVLGT